MSRLFLLEDDPGLVRGLTFAFQRQGHTLEVAETLREALERWRDGAYDLLVLDVSLPDGSGFDFCAHVRRSSSVPILFVTASDEEMDIIQGLELGGDDYLTKPFRTGELAARVAALLRRSQVFSAGATVLRSGGIRVDLLQGQAWKDGQPLDLTAGEYRLLCFFLRHPNVVLSKRRILEDLWDCEGNFVDGNTLTVYIRRLRVKIEDDPGNPRRIVTVRRMGYRWDGNGE